ncbi:MAG TPA: exopolysaccharide biosynthesis polyprenyl glycosylphosphotransferase [Candidatus Binataceae bacterium]|nr:exopolysaccharide biosynthesis polyprenyl glycosylphosphotransferase [Candidatus Binataceae bacterium]
MFAGELQRQSTVFAAADTAAIAGGFAAAFALSEPEAGVGAVGPAPMPLAAAAIALVALWMTTFRFVEDRRESASGIKQIMSVAVGCLVAIAIAFTAAALCGVRIPNRVLALALAGSIACAPPARRAALWCLKTAYAAPQIRTPLVVFGFTPAAQSLVNGILTQPTAYSPIAFIDDGPGGRQYRGLPVLPETAFASLAAACSGLEAAIAVADESRALTERILDMCRTRRVRWWLVPWMPGSSARALEVQRIGELALVSVPGRRLEGLNLAVKRMFDLAVATLFLGLAAPVMAIAAAAIWLCDGSPVLFRQTRVGIHGKRFEILKLRTMSRGTADEPHREYVEHWILRNGSAPVANGKGHHAPVFKLADDERVTSVGRILRRFSADELPQLINVLRGEMSLIGPRPALPYELELYRDWHWQRLDAPPGITGLWQVSGRNRLPFDEMVRLDLHYIRDWSLAGDLKILLRTVPVLLQGDGM